MFGAAPFAISPLGVGIESTSEGSTDPVIVDVTAGDTSAVVTYTGVATHYRLDGGASVAIGASPYTIAGLTANTEYTIELTADGVTWTDEYAFGTDNSGAGGGEIPAGISGSLAASESVPDSASVSGGVRVSGSIATTETDSDSAAFVGAVAVRGSLGAVDPGGDTASIAAEGSGPAISGSVQAVESALDGVAILGSVRISGYFAVIEAFSDTAAVSYTEGDDETYPLQGLTQAFPLSRDSQSYPLSGRITT